MGCFLSKQQQRQQQQQQNLEIATDSPANYGIPLKRIKFPWKSTRPMEELMKGRQLFWETCEAYGVGGTAFGWKGTFANQSQGEERSLASVENDLLY